MSHQHSLEESISASIKSYQELNSRFVDELDEEPSPLEFLRYVAQNRPFVVRKGARTWKAHQKWCATYLVETMGEQLVNVAITPHGYADSPVYSQQHGICFVKPYEREEQFDQVLQKIRSQEFEPNSNEPARYAQTRMNLARNAFGKANRLENDNLRNEYELLFADVPKDVAFARIALGHAPDAVNFWLGNSRSTTALHRDNYENIYAQILGEKHFVLLPPIEAPCINECQLPAATYRLAGEGSLRGVECLSVELDDPPEAVPFAIWDPDLPEKQPTGFSHLSSPMRVTLAEGDLLYLPALWYHKVTQTCSAEGLCCSVNYWYDMDFSGSFYSLSTLMHSVGLLATGDGGNKRVDACHDAAVDQGR